ncbi:MAG: response regulator [Cyanobacteria bacterium P01_A01_bin.17]
MIQQAPTQQETFSFGPQELSQKLLQLPHPETSGYWKISFDRLARKNHHWYIGLSANQEVCHTGTQPFSCQTLLKIIKRYLPQSRREPTRSFLAGLHKTSKEQSLSTVDTIEELIQMNVLDLKQLADILRLKILADFELYLSIGAGEAVFVPDESLAAQMPIPGLPIEMLLKQTQQRQVQWQRVKQIVPSMNVIPILDTECLEQSELPESQRQWLKGVVRSGKTLNDISVLVAKDVLEIATAFAKFMQAGVIRLDSATQSEPGTVMIIDDSPMVLMQFQRLVTALGHPVVVNQEAEKSIPMISQVKPAIIFIDINMPGISGFELVKQIRQTPEIAAIPLVILTGEQKLSNKWRAQWSGCDFLTKPLSMNEVNQFQVALQEKLETVMSAASV